MSYRTRVNETQIFGNNEYYQEWIDFIRSERSVTMRICPITSPYLSYILLIDKLQYNWL